MGKQDIEIARAVKLQPIQAIGEMLGLNGNDLEPYGTYKAKIRWDVIERTTSRPDGTLVLVTAMTPTPAGEGKSTTTIGLADGLRRLGKRSIVAMREPSLGPVFGVKGGAARRTACRARLASTSRSPPRSWRSCAWPATCTTSRPGSSASSSPTAAMDRSSRRASSKPRAR